ncbi:uncharacterized protein MEPE_05719 [Melanopsichium pennsylvanicum]|uniref:DUF1746 domain-containing protein n=2 Tax=Melanopsichium pennsylvanicum TaxID=63383 RepID=A0AAJ4XQ07_9BASI|nr:putative protein [Melanopsichium pennsylvanicum 4]SNX87009.1 uncharacterized protein MEPE_05719 [Melanopsichium pennsylvanicum]
MYFERKQLVQSLDLLCFTLFVYTYLLDNRTFLLIIKAALQVQFCNPVQMHPTWSLPFFVVFLLTLNTLLAIAHQWTPARITNTGDAIFIDFIGHTASTLPNRLHMLFIDAAVCFVQLLMVVVAFEMGKDETRPDGELSGLDDLTSLLEEEDIGQGWDVRDEEAAMFGLDEQEERKRQRSTLTHHIAVIQFRPIIDQILSRHFLPAPPAEGTNDAPSSDPTALAVPSLTDSARPDTTRIRRFSRRPRSGPLSNTLTQEPSYVGLGPVSADNSWPPMWLILARNMIGGEQRMPSFRPMRGLASIRDNITRRFRRNIGHAAAPDRSQYTRVNPDAPPNTV